jgi:hypothetical protein
MQQAPIVGLAQVVSHIQLSHNLAFPMATLQLYLNLVLDPCLHTPIKDICYSAIRILIYIIYS